MKIHTVNATFFEDKLSQSHIDLKTPGLSENDRLSIRLMQETFKEYLGIKDDKKTITKVISIGQMLDDISNKFNKYLDVFSIEKCEKIQTLCWNVRKYKCPNYSVERKRVSVDELANVTLRMYRKASKEYYLAAKQFLESPDTLVYLNNQKMSNYFDCSALSCHFIACYREGLATYPTFIHETQHGVDDMMFDIKYPIFIELAPIFFELLTDDYIENKYGARDLHFNRLKNHNSIMSSVYEYARVLRKFDACGRKITTSNLGVILGINTKEDLVKAYTTIMKDNFISGVKYLISFMKAIELRDVYYNDKKAAIKKLQACTSGDNTKINYTALPNAYEKFLTELDRKRIKTYMKRF